MVMFAVAIISLWLLIVFLAEHHHRLPAKTKCRIVGIGLAMIAIVLFSFARAITIDAAKHNRDAWLSFQGRADSLGCAAKSIQGGADHVHVQALSALVTEMMANLHARDEPIDEVIVLKCFDDEYLARTGMTYQEYQAQRQAEPDQASAVEAAQSAANCERVFRWLYGRPRQPSSLQAGATGK